MSFKKIKEGDWIYNVDWECFAKVQKFKNGSVLYHKGTKLKMVVSPPSKSWIKIEQEALENLIQTIQNENKRN